MKNESTLLNLSSDFIKFSVTSVKPYYDSADGGTDINDQNISNATNFSNEIVHPDLFEDAANRISENFSDNQSTASIIRSRDRFRKHSIEIELIFLIYVSFLMPQNLFQNRSIQPIRVFRN